MELVELEVLKDATVGLPSVTGMSTKESKRLTIVLYVVENTFIILMVEHTSGLDARAVAILM